MSARINCRRQEVRGHDGRVWPSVRAAARDLGCTGPALYHYAEWRDRGTWIYLRAYPNPQNVGRRGGTRRRS